MNIIKNQCRMQLLAPFCGPEPRACPPSEGITSPHATKLTKHEKRCVVSLPYSFAVYSFLPEERLREAQLQWFDNVLFLHQLLLSFHFVDTPVHALSAK